MQPEMDTILTDISNFRLTADRFADLLEQLPKQIADERSATVADVSNLVTSERKAVMKAIDDKATTIHKINKDIQNTLDQVERTFANVHQTTSDVEKLLQGTQQTVNSANDLVTTVDKLIARFESDEPGHPSRPFDINEYINALEKIEATVNNLNRLVLSVDKTSTPLVTKIMDEFNKSAEDRIDHIFWRLILLFSIIGGIVFVILTVYFVLKRKIPA
jgi:methyl-accepting chemotaxis protein